MVHYLSQGWHNYGNHVRVTHKHGNDVYETIYAHLNTINVKAGDYVFRGQELGKMGSTGNSTGTHLHLTLKKNGNIINPSPYFGG